MSCTLLKSPCGCALLVPLCAGFVCTVLPVPRIALGLMCGCMFATALAGCIAIRGGIRRRTGVACLGLAFS